MQNTVKLSRQLTKVITTEHLRGRVKTEDPVVKIT